MVDDVFAKFTAEVDRPTRYIRLLHLLLSLCGLRGHGHQLLNFTRARVVGAGRVVTSLRPERIPLSLVVERDEARLFGLLVLRCFNEQLVSGFYHLLI